MADTSATASARPGKSKYWRRETLSRREGGRDADSSAVARVVGDIALEDPVGVVAEVIRNTVAVDTVSGGEDESGDGKMFAENL